jgi:hypothetical protein
MQWLLPFSNGWRKVTLAEHVEEIERFRHGFFLHFAALALIGFFELAYFRFFFVRLHSFG